MGTAASGVDAPGAVAPEMGLLIKTLRAFLAQRRARTDTVLAPHDTAALRARFGFEPRGARRSQFMLNADVALDLGHPTTASCAGLLTTYDEDLVRHGRISMVGGDLCADGRQPFGQMVVVVLHRGEAFAPDALCRAQFLPGMLPGYVVRTFPGRMWARISAVARGGGLSLPAIGSAIVIAASQGGQRARSVEVVFVTGQRADVEAMAPIANRAARMERRALQADLRGSMVEEEEECSEEGCARCENEPVCATLRDVDERRSR